MWRNSKRPFKAASVQYRGREYKNALLLVDDETREVEVQTGQGLFKKKMGRLVNLGVVTERALAEGDKLIIGEVAVVLESHNDVDTIARLLYIPDVGKEIALAKISAEKFLRARSSALAPLVKLKGNPRDALLSAFEEVPEGADPVGILVSDAEKVVQEGVATMKSEVEMQAKDLPLETRNRIYAVVYAVGLVQDSYLKADESTLTGALALLSLAAPTAHLQSGELKGMNMDEATDLLLSSGFVGLDVEN